eukprot:CAMPEP_0119052610 /NCGR_PEP_ID=MMETSP1177-20130426/73855_1 /TAXON_ID=2985 /ORGANISM="Ochromonas sp, Strain CCMP1899" /LENGTH=750 /DNA_ID=CAMNT_0007032241 /DNA_START=671 /DNA_END=2923 /DNA_ORIENTATION=+
MKSMTFVDNPSMSHEEGRERKVSQTSMKSISHEECRDDDKGSSSKEGTIISVTAAVHSLQTKELQHIKKEKKKMIFDLERFQAQIEALEIKNRILIEEKESSEIQYKILCEEKDCHIMDGTKKLEVQMQVMEGNKRDMESIIEELRSQVAQFQDRELQTQTSEALLVERVDKGLLSEEVQVYKDALNASYIDIENLKKEFTAVSRLHAIVAGDSESMLMEMEVSKDELVGLNSMVDNLRIQVEGSKNELVSVNKMLDIGIQDKRDMFVEIETLKGELSDLKSFVDTLLIQSEDSKQSVGNQVITESLYKDAWRDSQSDESIVFSCLYDPMKDTENSKELDVLKTTAINQRKVEPLLNEGGLHTDHISDILIVDSKELDILKASAVIQREGETLLNGVLHTDCMSDEPIVEGSLCETTAGDGNDNNDDYYDNIDNNNGLVLGLGCMSDGPIVDGSLCETPADDDNDYNGNYNNNDYYDNINNNNNDNNYNDNNHKNDGNDRIKARLIQMEINYIALKKQSQIIESNPTPGYLDVPPLSKSRKLTENRELKPRFPDIYVSEIQLSNVDIDELEVDEDTLQGEINQLCMQKRELKGGHELTQLYLQNNELEADRDTLQCEINQICSHTDELECNKSQIESEIIQLVSEKYDLNVDKDKLHCEIRHLMLEKHEITKILIKEKENLLQEKLKADDDNDYNGNNNDYYGNIDNNYDDNNYNDNNQKNGGNDRIRASLFLNTDKKLSEHVLMVEYFK